MKKAILLAMTATLVLAACGGGTVSSSSPPPVPPPASPSPAPATSPAPPDMAPEMERLVAHLPHGSVSVAARNLQTGAVFRFGSSGGQTVASIFKVNIVQAVMLRHQATGEPLSPSQSRDANVTIITSDNDSATRLYQGVGGANGVRSANHTLGLGCTEPNEHFWGLTTTCAEDQVQLLYQLESVSSPLVQASREFILGLMQNVTPTQRWGVPVVADPDTIFSVKNGWLDLNHGRDWVINSIGIVTYRGQTLVMATLSQNNDTMAAGISLDEQLAKLAAESVTVP